MPSSSSQSTVGFPTGIGRRLGALLYDILLIIALWAFTLFLWVVPTGGEAVTGALVTWVLGAEWVGFYLLFWSRQGQTLGMQAWRIKLVTVDGQPPSLKHMLKRVVCAPISFACAGLGYVWFYVGDKQQAWHDRFSDTMVVHIPKAD